MLGMLNKMAEVVDQALHEVCRTFGIKELFAEQRRALLSFVSGKDVFVNLPTGYGKSLVFQMAPILHAEIAKLKFDTAPSPAGKLHYTENPILVVLSPLLNLIEDQKQHLRKLGIAVASIGDDKEENSRIEKGECNLVYTSPESLLNNSKWRNMLSSEKFKQKLIGVVVDEARCISYW